MQKIKFLIIGAGSIGSRHAHNLTKLGHEFQIISYRGLKDIDQILSKWSFDAVIVATSTQVRYEILEPCFNKLIPVYIEKPLTFDIEILNEIYKLPRNYLKKCFAGFMMRFHPLTQFILNLDYSSTYSFSFDIGYNVNKWRSNWNFSKSYASKKQGGGVLLDLCHEIDLANLLFSPLILKDVLSLDHTKFSSVDFSSLITFANLNNMMGTVSMDYICPVNRRKLVVKGINFVDEIDFIKGVYNRTMDDRIIVKKFPIERNCMFIDIMNAFTEAILGYENSRLAVPSLDVMKSSCELIANAWSRRTFVGSLNGDIH